MNEAQAWREIAEKYAAQEDWSLWLGVYDLYLKRKTNQFTYRAMVLRIESHLKASKRFCPPVDVCLLALFLALESEE